MPRGKEHPEEELVRSFRRGYGDCFCVLPFPPSPLPSFPPSLRTMQQWVRLDADREDAMRPSARFVSTLIGQTGNRGRTWMILSVLSLMPLSPSLPPSLPLLFPKTRSRPSSHPPPSLPPSLPLPPPPPPYMGVSLVILFQLPRKRRFKASSSDVASYSLRFRKFISPSSSSIIWTWGRKRGRKGRSERVSVKR